MIIGENTQIEGSLEIWTSATISSAGVGSFQSLEVSPTGLRFPNDAFGGSGDTAGIRLVTRGTENQSLEIYATNDTNGDWVNLVVPSVNDAKVNGNTIWNAGNFDPSSKSDVGHTHSILNITDRVSQYVDDNYDVGTAKYLRWKNYGDGHEIIDASQGLSPTGSTISNTNPDNPWAPSYPTLMGWNGSQTYGVRVDRSRYSDNADALEGHAASYFATAGHNHDATYLKLIGGDMTGSIQFGLVGNGAASPAINFNGGIPSTSYKWMLGDTSDGTGLSIFVNGSARVTDGGVNATTIRNERGSLVLGYIGFATNIVGSDVQANGNSIWHAGNFNPANYSLTGHYHSSIQPFGDSVNSSAAPSSWASPGLYMTRVYNQDYPTTYGNLFTMTSQGGTQLFQGWAGGNAAPEGMWFRNKRDTFDGWSPWQRVLDTSSDSASISNWNTAYTSAHFHINKSTLDVINQSLGTGYWPTFTGMTLRGNPGKLSLESTTTEGAYVSQTATGNGTDQNVWDSFIQGAVLKFRTVNDAYTNASSWLEVTRVGFSPADVLFNATVTAPKLNIQANAAQLYNGVDNPPYYIGQVMADNDGWKIYGEGTENSGRLVLEVNDDGDELIVIKTRKTYAPYTTNVYQIWHEGNFNPSNKSDVGHTHSLLNITDRAAQYVDDNYDVGTAKYLRWNNYGDNHEIIDASQGLAPNGATINNGNSDLAWSPSYPTLMGWNGVNTYGVRVDRSRYSDNADVLEGHAASYFAVSVHVHDDRYYTESESDSRFLGIGAKAVNSDLFDGIDSSRFVFGANGSATSYVPGLIGGILKSGFYNTNSSTDSPVPSTWTHVIHSNYTADDSWAWQLAANFEAGNSEEYWTRIKVNGQYKDWRKIWTTKDISQTMVDNWNTAYTRVANSRIGVYCYNNNDTIEFKDRTSNGTSFGRIHNVLGSPGYFNFLMLPEDPSTVYGVLGHSADGEWYVARAGMGLNPSNYYKIWTTKDITQTNITNWNAAYTNNHTHLNKDQLDTIDQNLGTGYTVSFNQVITTNDGNGENIRVGNDAWIGDCNLANTLQIKGMGDSTKGYIRIGNDTNALGYNGTYLTYSGPMAFGPAGTKSPNQYAKYVFNVGGNDYNGIDVFAENSNKSAFLSLGTQSFANSTWTIQKRDDGLYGTTVGCFAIEDSSASVDVPRWAIIINKGDAGNILLNRSVVVYSGKNLSLNKDVDPSVGSDPWVDAAIVVNRASTSQSDFSNVAGIGFHNQGINASLFYYDPATSQFKYRRSGGGTTQTFWDSGNFDPNNYSLSGHIHDVKDLAWTTLKYDDILNHVKNGITDSPNGGDGMFGSWAYHFKMIHSANPNDWQFLLGVDFFTDSIGFRRKASGSWQAPQYLWHTGNFSQTNINNWNTAYTNNHTHTNKANLDSINQDLGNGSTPTFYQLYINNNGPGEGIRIGDDAWIGDVNVANTLWVKGVQTPSHGFIGFGSDSTSLGYNGVSLSYGGRFDVTQLRAGASTLCVAASTTNADIWNDQGGSYAIHISNGQGFNFYQGTPGAGSPIAGINSNGTINSQSLTTSRVVVSDTSKNLISSNITTTELGHLAGTSANIQTQINQLASASISGVGAGTVNRVSKFTTGTGIGNSNINDDGSTISFLTHITGSTAAFTGGLNVGTDGIRFPDNAFGGGGDFAWIRLISKGGEAQSMELYVGNDIDDWVNLVGPDNNFAKVNGNTIWNAGNLTQANINNWNTAYTSAHFHNNRTQLDTINQNLSTTSQVMFADLTTTAATYARYGYFGTHSGWVDGTYALRVYGDTLLGHTSLVTNYQFNVTKNITPTTASNTNYAKAPIVINRATQDSSTTTVAGIGFHNAGVNAATLYYDAVTSVFKYNREVAGPLVTIWDDSNFTPGNYLPKSGSFGGSDGYIFEIESGSDSGGLSLRLTDNSDGTEYFVVRNNAGDPSLIANSDRTVNIGYQNYQQVKPILSIGDQQYGLGANSGYLNLYSSGGGFRAFSKSGSNDAVYLGDFWHSGNFNPSSKSDAGHTHSILNITDRVSQYVDDNYDVGTAKYLRWKNYGDGHEIIDASQGLSPTGSTISNGNSDMPWAPTYPTLMGWNGVNTYGVRVDRSRYSDNADALEGHAASYFATAGHNHDDRYYTEAETNLLLSDKSNVGHTHDDRYYTESESDSRFLGIDAISNVISGSGYTNRIPVFNSEKTLTSYSSLYYIVGGSYNDNVLNILHNENTHGGSLINIASGLYSGDSAVKFECSTGSARLSTDYSNKNFYLRTDCGGDTSYPLNIHLHTSGAVTVNRLLAIASSTMVVPTNTGGNLQFSNNGGNTSFNYYAGSSVTNYGHRFHVNDGGGAYSLMMSVDKYALNVYGNIVVSGGSAYGMVSYYSSTTIGNDVTLAVIENTGSSITLTLPAPSNGKKLYVISMDSIGSPNPHRISPPTGCSLRIVNSSDTNSTIIPSSPLIITGRAVLLIAVSSTEWIRIQ